MQNTTQKIGKKTPGTSSTKSYIELINAFTPRRIDSEEYLNATQEVIDSLLDRGNLTPDERDYLHLLGLLVSDYEERHYSLPDIYGVELLKVLIEEFNLRQQDIVPIFRTQSIVSEVLSGKRQLTVNHIQKLAEFFHISPAAFLKQG
ncbi:MAG: type II toxin-antitoxin system HigA family antitoxin [Xenococcaceae cyanobacterium]